MIVIGGVNLGDLPNNLFFFSNGSNDADWKDAKHGYLGDVAVNGLTAKLHTNAGIPYAGTIFTNDTTLGDWQGIVDANPTQAFHALGQTALISGLSADLVGALQQINALPATVGYADRVFTTEVVSYPEMTHIGESKDFSPVIAKALELGGYAQDTSFTGINGGKTVMTGFGHGTVLGVADQVIDAVKTGAIRYFFLVGGCDGARPGRNYYTEFVKQTPPDTVVLTLACGKYRFNDLDLGTIGGLPRLMDMGQCNDAYSAIKVALALAEAFDCGVNDLPLSMVLSWYEQKAVCILLTLLYLGIQNIRLGPTLPAFLSPNVLQNLVENFHIAPITTPEEDLKKLLG